MKTITRNFRFWIPVFLWLGIIAVESFGLSSSVTGGWLLKLLRWFHVHLSWQAFQELNHILRKTGHFTGYGILCVLFFRAWFHTLVSRSRITRASSASLVANALHSIRVRCALLAVNMTLITAILDEWHQAFDPRRTSSGWDVALDVTGGIIFLLFGLFVLKLWRSIPIDLQPAAPTLDYLSGTTKTS
ncbi:MAG TPA: VanZ family protein [Terriglobales bacterium]|nr:VanZ family protein [Terriglobales bacterium]